MPDKAKGKDKRKLGRLVLCWRCSQRFFLFAFTIILMTWTLALMYISGVVGGLWPQHGELRGLPGTRHNLPAELTEPGWIPGPPAIQKLDPAPNSAAVQRQTQQTSNRSHEFQEPHPNSDREFVIRVPRPEETPGTLLWKGAGTSLVPHDAAALARHFLDEAVRRKTSFRILDVGGCDSEWEKTDGPFKGFLENQSVYAMVFEPVPRFWEKIDRRLRAHLNSDGRLRAVNAALCLGEQRSRAFYTVGEQYEAQHPDDPLVGMGSFDYDLVLKLVPKEHVETINVECLRPTQVFALEGTSPIGSEPQNVDAMILDAESISADLMLSFMSIPSFRPSLITMEIRHVHSWLAHPFNGVLHQLGYEYWLEENWLVCLRTSFGVVMTTDPKRRTNWAPPAKGEHGHRERHGHGHWHGHGSKHEGGHLPLPDAFAKRGHAPKHLPHLPNIKGEHHPKGRGRGWHRPKGGDHQGNRRRTGSAADAQ